MLCAYCFLFKSDDRCDLCNRYTINFLEPYYAVSDFLLEKNHVLPNHDPVLPLKLKDRWISKYKGLPIVTDDPINPATAQIVEPWNRDVASFWTHSDWDLSRLSISFNIPEIDVTVQVLASWHKNCFRIMIYPSLQFVYKVMNLLPITGVHGHDIDIMRQEAGLEQRIKK